MINSMMDSVMDSISLLPVDLFLTQITYLPFRDVITLCSLNKKLRNYSLNSDHSNRWKSLIDRTYGDIYDYQHKLQSLLGNSPEGNGSYNYLIYVKLVHKLDPITQLMIYYRLNDTVSFNHQKFTKNQQFLALFLLNKKTEIENYLPDAPYKACINIMYGKKLYRQTLDRIMLWMAREGSIKGVLFIKEKGANLNISIALRAASFNGHLEVVKYLVEQGANVREYNDLALRSACKNGHLNVVKYLVERGADIHALDDWALELATQGGHLAVVEYLESLP